MGFEIEFDGIHFHILVEEDVKFVPLDSRFQKLTGFNFKQIESGKLSFCNLTIKATFNDETFIFFGSGYPLAFNGTEDELMKDLNDMLEANRLIERIRDRVISYFQSPSPIWRKD
ncbi:MAG: hypothetical protein Fur0010_11490 [Bdellovibrio sp.]